MKIVILYYFLLFFEGRPNVEETLEERIRKYFEGQPWGRSFQSRTENEPNNHSPHLEGSSRRSSTENEPNSSSRHFEDLWNNPPNVEVGKPGSPPNVKETLEKRVRKYIESQQPKKEQPVREHQDNDQDSGGGGDDF